ncbi:hypothetical protein GCM10007170_08450 [Arthrobacter liuii]|uniref:GH15-like domain-containing protein n=1 Tax=Arthrobacter liuii TaxID=1476996 RepID=A0ABQ2AHN9_9MICC|nr:hypothetical protein GCM10007170_08450 [Arthrobacter liuii]
MVKGIQQSGLPGPEARWSTLGDTIHKDVMTHGFASERNTFVRSYGSTELDASLLLIPRVGFLPHDHPRVSSRSANDVGLLSEEWDPKAGRQLGNTPQAFSHFPLIHCAPQLQHGRSRHSNTPLPGPKARTGTGSMAP